MADKIDENPFFMVYVQGERQPQFIHEDYDNAVFEAKRLARHTGEKAYVLGTISAFEIREFFETKYQTSDLPF